jgi:hypothetical protein
VQNEIFRIRFDFEQKNSRGYEETRRKKRKTEEKIETNGRRRGVAVADAGASMWVQQPQSAAGQLQASARGSSLPSALPSLPGMVACKNAQRCFLFY